MHYGFPIKANDAVPDSYAPSHTCTKSTCILSSGPHVTRGINRRQITVKALSGSYPLHHLS